MNTKTELITKSLTIGTTNYIDLLRATWTRGLTMSFAFTLTTGATPTTSTLSDAITRVQLVFNGSNVVLDTSMKLLLEYWTAVYGLSASTEDTIPASQTGVVFRLKVHHSFTPNDNVNSGMSPFSDTRGWLPFQNFDTAQLIIDVSNPDSTNITAMACVLTIQQDEIMLTAEEQKGLIAGGVSIVEYLRQSVPVSNNSNYADVYEFDGNTIYKSVYIGSGSSFGDRFRIRQKRPNNIILHDKSAIADAEKQKAMYQVVPAGVMIDFDELNGSGLPTGTSKGDFVLESNGTGTTGYQMLIKRWSVLQ